MGAHGRVIASDLNHAMLAEGLKKIGGKGSEREDHLPAGQCRTSGIRRQHVRRRHHGVLHAQCGKPRAGDRGNSSRHEAGRPFVCLEFSRPVFGWLRALYDWYSFKLLPWIGTKVARDTTGVYEYLPASIRTFPDQERLCHILRDAGFREVSYRNLTGGIVAIHRAVK